MVNQIQIDVNPYVLTRTSVLRITRFARDLQQVEGCCDSCDSLRFLESRICDYLESQNRMFCDRKLCDSAIHVNRKIAQMCDSAIHVIRKIAHMFDFANLRFT